MNALALLNKHGLALRALGARRLGIFGSVARGEAGAASDVDVYVEFIPEARTYDNFFALHELLEELFARPVDLVTDGALTESQARLILPTVQYAALDA
ncbi:MAG TPA: nucleotidyltransferase domain-containing protein [Candidatus Paceibacterota bacterium]|nr:nucleotidyltransferase domain-containing protein [Verrucomicrobiota bacterium]HRZ39103.1 nucleotidyltransferase domain-containing protein [Candidatus Paceibacterota bacterium]HRZ58598.1 nucleotidyltransferase domain-containing protein [Candidatus Paceibacterota bacterium]